jgi:2-polyprenyl-3-methyl-5-hydroxy-6-metoxy-1,4-benzoquinol methylase
MDERYAAAYPELYRRHWWWRARERILLGTIRELLGRARGVRILDVGCGAGLFFDALEPFGHVEGIEADRSAIEGAGRWRDRIRAGELDASFRPSAPFDLILMLDVVEHVADPESLLRRASELLAPDGHILLTVPAFNWLWTAHDDLNHHLRRYTATELTETVGRAGLVVRKRSYLFQSLVIPKLLTRWKEAIGPPDPQVPAIPRPAINQAVQWWFHGERAVARWLPFGSSLLAVVAKV